MITCQQADHLPAIDCSLDTTQPAGSRTLTEVVCAALYGAALKPGREQGSFDWAYTGLRLECRALWRNDNGPGWLRPHLELIAKGKAWPFKTDTQDDCEKRTLRSFATAQDWLSKGRKLAFAHRLPAELAEKALRLANMTDTEAIAYALAETDRIECAEKVINAKAASFYDLLSKELATGTITLNGIATDPETNAWLPRTRGEPPHQPIPTDYFELPLIHDLFNNSLEADFHSTEAKMVASIFDRIERQNNGWLVNWSDVRLPPKDVGRLLTEFRGEGEVTGDPLLGHSQLARPTDTVPALRKPQRRSFEKIEAAIKAEEQATGKPLPALRPVERYKRLTDRMRDQGLSEREIPHERTFREFFNNGPGKSEKSG